MKQFDQFRFIQMVSQTMVFIAQSNVETILADLRAQVITVLDARYPGLKIETDQKPSPAKHLAEDDAAVLARNICLIQSLDWIKIQSDY
jgi:hypothetical protein